MKHMLKKLLKNTAAVGVSSKSKGLTSESLADEHVHIAINALHGSQDVVGVLVLGALNNFAFQLLHE